MADNRVLDHLDNQGIKHGWFFRHVLGRSSATFTRMMQGKRRWTQEDISRTVAYFRRHGVSKADLFDPSFLNDPTRVEQRRRWRRMRSTPPSTEPPNDKEAAVESRARTAA